MDGSATIGDVLTHAVLLLAGLVAARAALLGVLDLAARLAAATGRRVATIAAALRPRLARLLLATVVGLGVPAAAAVAPSTPASAAATRPEADTGAGRAGRAVVVPAPLPAGRAEIYVVRPGDTLWDIARRHLPASSAAADLARSWPRGTPPTARRSVRTPPPPSRDASALPGTSPGRDAGARARPPLRHTRRPRSRGPIPGPRSTVTHVRPPARRAHAAPASRPRHHPHDPHRPPAVQGTLALEWQLPGDVDAVPSPDRALRLVSRTPALDLDTDPAVAVVATSRADLPDPGPWTAQLVQAVLEVLAHERPRQQLVRWLAPEVYAGLGVHLAASPTRPAAGGAPSGRARRTVSSIHVSEPAEGSSRRAPWCSAAAAPVPSPYASRAGAADGGAPA